MTEDKKFLTDEARKIAQHEEIKRELVEEVHHEIEGRVALGPQERAKVETVAEELKQKAIREISITEAELERSKNVARVSQIVAYIFSLIYGLVGLEIVLELLGARQRSGFKQFLDATTRPLLAPFKGLMPDPSVGSFQLMLSYIIALIVYALLHAAIKGLLRLMVEKKSAI